ncbi:MAG TPA: hypothetical protein VG867_09870 [Rhizomicrobium sp.]|nr:hypothetical protein [Rhizomicrobium sp.]
MRSFRFHCIATGLLIAALSTSTALSDAVDDINARQIAFGNCMAAAYAQFAQASANCQTYPPSAILECTNNAIAAYQADTQACIGKLVAALRGGATQGLESSTMHGIYGGENSNSGGEGATGPRGNTSGDAIDGQAGESEESKYPRRDSGSDTRAGDGDRRLTAGGAALRDCLLRAAHWYEIAAEECGLRRQGTQELSRCEHNATYQFDREKQACFQDYPIEEGGNYGPPPGSPGVGRPGFHGGENWGGAQSYGNRNGAGGSQEKGNQSTPGRGNYGRQPSPQ